MLDYKNIRNKYNGYLKQLKLLWHLIRCNFFLRKLRKKIFSFSDLCNSLADYSLDYYVNNDNDGKGVLLFSHSFDRTGSPTALLYLAIYFKKIGYRPVVVSRYSGEITNELKKNKIEYLLVNPRVILLLSENVIEVTNFIVSCTVYTSLIISAFNGTKIPVVWWLHDANQYYTKKVVKQLPVTLGKNVHVYTGGEIAEKAIKLHRDYETKELLFAVPSNSSNEKNYADKYTFADGKTVLAVLGNKCERKGQDLLLEAIEKNRKSFEGLCFVFIGKRQKNGTSFSEKYDKYIKHLRGVAFDLNQVSLDELYFFVEHVMNYLICPSREEPMSIVATNALQYGKPVICSDNTGIAKYVKNGLCGFVYENESVNDLAEKIFTAVNLSEDNKEKIRVNALNTYHNIFSFTAFENNINELIKLIEGEN